MWTLVYLAQNKDIADRLNSELVKEGVLTKIKPVGKDVINETSYYEVWVPEGEVEEAHNIICELGY